MHLLTLKFHENYRRLREQLEALFLLTKRMRKGKADYASGSLEVVRFMREGLLAHVQWTERVLYALADEQAIRNTSRSGTGPLRAVNVVIGRRVRELEQIQLLPELPMRAFVRVARELIAKALRHLTEEERTLRPTIQTVQGLLLSTSHDPIPERAHVWPSPLGSRADTGGKSNA